MREKHGFERRGWIKVHITVDVNTRKPVTFEITDERTTDHEMAKSLLEKLNLEDALMDGAYDKEEVFKFLKGMCLAAQESVGRYLFQFPRRVIYIKTHLT